MRVVQKVSDHGLPVDATLRDGTVIRLRLASERDEEGLHILYNTIVGEGTSYPHDRPLTQEEFVDYWVRGKSTVVAYAEGSVGVVSTPKIAGAFYLRANWPGRAGHVANAGFMVASEWRNRGLGRLLGTTMLKYARHLGYRSVIFNLVFSENRIARGLWRQLGFQEMARLPGVIHTDDGSYQDAVVMFRSLM